MYGVYYNYSFSYVKILRPNEKYILELCEVQVFKGKYSNFRIIFKDGHSLQGYFS